MKIFGKTFISFSIFIAALSVSVSSAFAQQEQLINEWLKTLDGPNVDISNSGLVTTGNTSILDDLTFTFGAKGNDPTKLVFDEVVFENVSDAGPQDFRAGLIKASNITLQNSEISASVNTLLFESLDFPKLADLTPLFTLDQIDDEKEALTIGLAVMEDVYDMLGEATFKEISISNLKLNEVENDEFQLVLDKFGFFDMRRGLLATYGFTDLTFAGKDGGNDVTVKVAAAEYNDLDFDTMRKVLIAKYFGFEPDRTWKRVLGKGSITGISVDAAEGSGGIKVINIGEYRMRQTYAPLGQILTELIEEGEKANEDPAQALILMAEIYDSIALDEISVEGAVFSGKDKDDKQIDLQLDAYRFGPFSLEDGLKQIAVEGLKLAVSDTVDFALGSYGVADLKFPSIEALRALKGQEIEDPQVLLKVLPTLGKIFITDVAADVEKNDETPAFEASLKAFVFEAPSYIGAVPSALKLTLDQLDIPTNIVDDRQAKQAFESLGMTNIIVNSDIGLTYDSAASSLVIEDSNLSVDKAGSVRIKGAINGIPLAVFENPNERSLGSIAFTGALAGAEIGYTDDGLTDGVLGAVANEQKVTPAQMREALLLQLPLMLRALQSPEFSADVREKATAFLNNPGTITLKVGASSPIAMLQLAGALSQGPSEIVKLLKPVLTLE